MLVFDLFLLLNKAFNFIQFNLQKVNDWLSCVFHPQLKHHLEAKKERFDLNEFFNLVKVLNYNLEIQDCLSVILGLVAHGCDVVDEDAVEVKHPVLVGLTVPIRLFLVQVAH